MSALPGELDRHRPELDGIRALAVAAVVASHTNVPFAAGGWMGVEAFFVLSGYLITGLLLREHGRTGGVELRKFYIRRVLRLYPALLVLLIAGAFFFRDLGDNGTLAGYGRTAAQSGLYLQDLAAGLFGKDFGGFGHTWSLAVEEQFYLIWPPILIWLLVRGRDPLRWAVCGTLVSWALMIGLIGHTTNGATNASYYQPWCRFSQLLVGAALAIAVSRWRTPSVVARAWFGWSAAMLCVLLVGSAAHWGRNPNLTWEAPSIAFSTALLLWHLARSDYALRRLLGCRPLVYTGRRSYGIYLYHFPILELLRVHTTGARSTIAIEMVALTGVVAVVSYRFVEMPFLRMKDRFRADQEAFAA